MATITHSGGTFYDSAYSMAPANLVVNRDVAPEDGWITEVSFWAGDDLDAGDTALVAAVIYITGVRKYFSSWRNFPQEAVSNRVFTGINVRMSKDQVIRWGPYNAQDAYSPLLHLLNESGAQTYLYYGAGENPSTIPDPIGSSYQTLNDVEIRSQLVYTPNNDPLAPTYGASAPANGATINSTNPTIDFNMPLGADSTYDTTEAIHVQVWREDTGTMMVDQIITPTSTELSNARFTRAYDTLPNATALSPGITYKMKARHQDSFGGWSVYSAERTFTTVSGPNVATSMTPNAKISAISGFNYVSTYSHPTSLQGTAADLEVWNAAGTTRLYSTSVTGLTLATGATYTKAEWHVDLAWGTNYTWRIRFKDSNNIWGEWSPKVAFKTNSAPSAPISLVPANNANYAGLTFEANGSDPDNDDLTGAQIQIVKVSDNTIVHDRTDTGITIDNASGAISYTLAGGVLVAGTAYKWRARTKDANFALQSWGAWSDYANFTWVTGATITQVAPSSTARTNIVRSPSPSWSLQGGVQDYWTPSLTDGSNTITGVFSADSPSEDDSAWEAVIGGKSLATSARLTSEMEAVDTSKPYLFTIWAKRMNSGQTSGAYFNILCYNASSTLVGTIRPSDFNGAINNTNLATSWTHYGGTIGMVGGTAWPATTTQVKIEIIPSAVTAATVQFTAVSMEKLPTFQTNSDWLNLRWWYGFFDGNTEIEPNRATGYQWTGVEGNSESNGVHILENLHTGVTPAYMGIVYAHTVAKQADKLAIDQWVIDGWEEVYDSGWVTTTRTLIPLPKNILKNQDRFRLRLQVRDANSVVVEPVPIEADTYYVGPPELKITGIDTDAAEGSITVFLADSTLSTDFGGIEIARYTDNEPQQIVARLGTPSPKSWRYDAPKSGIEYTFRARQIQIVGTDEVQGRWHSMTVDVNYSPNMFIKDIQNPKEYNVGFRILQKDFQPDLKGATESRHEIRGRRRPIIFTSEGRSWTRELTMYLNDTHGFDDSIVERWNKLEQMDDLRPTVVVLDSYHGTKMLAKIVGESSFDMGIGSARRVTFNLEAVDYSEDYRDRQGVL